MLTLPKIHKAMKTIVKYFFIFVLFSSFLTSCEPETSAPEDTPDVDPRDKFVGNWVCTETSKQNGQQTFTVGITLNPSNSSQVLISNFYLFGADEKANALITGNTITIPTQVFCSHTISGSGFIDNSKTIINWDYYVNDGQQTDTCTAIYKKSS